MIKFRKTTRTAIIFEQDGEMYEVESDTDVIAVLPRWLCNMIKRALRLGFILKLEVKAWKSNASFLNKLCYGYQMMGA